jgi:hypothetical protein
MPHLVTKSGAGRVRVGGEDLPEGAPLDASKWSTRRTLEARGYIRYVTDEEYEGALALRAAKENPFNDLTPAVRRSLEGAGITTVEQAKELGRDGLIALDGIGEASADKILALS